MGKKLPACASVSAHRLLRIGSIGLSNVVRMPVGRKAICPAKASLRRLAASALSVTIGEAALESEGESTI